MADPFVAEIRIVGFNFAATGWAFCDGQLIPISQNTALFSLLGTTYGGNGQTTFALPNLQGRAPMQAGQGPGLSNRFLGEEVGSEAVTLIQSEIPVHTHALNASVSPANSRNPTNNALARSRGASAYDPGVATTGAAAQAVGIAGSSFPHNNMQPYLTLNFIIALQGVFPPRG